MAKKRYTPEEIVAKLRQVDVLVSQGQNVADAIRQIGVSEVTYYRWRQGVRRAQDRAGQAPEGAGDGECPSAPGGLGPDAGQAHSAGGSPGKLLLYSGRMMQAPFLQIPSVRDHPARLLLLFEVSLCRLMMGSEGTGGAI